MSISQENNSNKNILGNFEVNEEKDIAVVSCELPRDIRSLSVPLSHLKTFYDAVQLITC